METIEMDLMQAQIAELTTEVARLQKGDVAEIIIAEKVAPQSKKTGGKKKAEGDTKALAISVGIILHNRRAVSDMTYYPTLAYYTRQVNPDTDKLEIVAAQYVRITNKEFITPAAIVDVENTVAMYYPEAGEWQWLPVGTKLGNIYSVVINGNDLFVDDTYTYYDSASGNAVCWDFS